MIAQTRLEAFAPCYGSLKPFRGHMVRAHAERRDGSRVSREGTVVYLGLRHVTVQSERMGNLYRIPLAAIRSVEAVP